MQAHGAALEVERLQQREAVEVFQQIARVDAVDLGNTRPQPRDGRDRHLDILGEHRQLVIALAVVDLWSWPLPISSTR